MPEALVAALVFSEAQLLFLALLFLAFLVFPEDFFSALEGAAAGVAVCAEAGVVTTAMGAAMKAALISIERNFFIPNSTVKEKKCGKNQKAFPVYPLRPGLQRLRWRAGKRANPGRWLSGAKFVAQGLRPFPGGVQRAHEVLLYMVFFHRGDGSVGGAAL